MSHINQSMHVYVLSLQFRPSLVSLEHATSMPQKVAIKVVHVSGQDESYKASELNHHSPLTKGWQSTR